MVKGTCQKLLVLIETSNQMYYYSKQHLAETQFSVYSTKSVQELLTRPLVVGTLLTPTGIEYLHLYPGS